MPVTDTEVWATAKEAAKILGMHLNSIYKLSKGNRVRTLRVGWMILYHRQDLQTVATYRGRTQDSGPGNEGSTKD